MNRGVIHDLMIRFFVLCCNKNFNKDKDKIKHIQLFFDVNHPYKQIKFNIYFECKDITISLTISFRLSYI